MPSEFFRASTTWVVDFRYDGHPRRWFKVFGQDIDVRALMVTELHQLYGDRAQLVEVREATEQEEGQYLRGDEPKNAFCPTGCSRRSRYELPEVRPESRTGLCRDAESLAVFKPPCLKSRERS